MTSKAKRAQYTLEFKLEAVRLVKAGQSMAAAATLATGCGFFDMVEFVCRPRPSLVSERQGKSARVQISGRIQ
jgi:hypothetical protein